MTSDNQTPLCFATLEQIQEELRARQRADGYRVIVPLAVRADPQGGEDVSTWFHGSFFAALGVQRSYEHLLLEVDREAERTGRDEEGGGP